MSLFVDTRFRSDKVEIMDDFSIEGPILEDTLNKLTSINKWLGGANVTMDGLKKLLENQPSEKRITLIDLGCGDGDMLRRVADYGASEGYNFQLIGIDANEETIKYATRLSDSFANIRYYTCDVFTDEFRMLNYDIVLSTLFLHHFNEDVMTDFLSMVLEKASIGIVVNDLHRHKLAYIFFKILCMMISNKMVISDGLTSILKGFKRSELEQLSATIGASSRIRWKWAFRFQWIIQKNICK